MVRVGRDDCKRGWLEVRGMMSIISWDVGKYDVPGIFCPPPTLFSTQLWPASVIINT